MTAKKEKDIIYIYTHTQKKKGKYYPIIKLAICLTLAKKISGNLYLINSYWFPSKFNHVENLDSLEVNEEEGISEKILKNYNYSTVCSATEPGIIA